MKRCILALGVAAALAAPAAAENNSYNPAKAARDAMNKAKTAVNAVEGKYGELQAEIEGKNDAPPPDAGYEKGGGNVGDGPRATARNVLATKGVDPSQALTPDGKRAVNEKMSEWRGERTDVTNAMARNAILLKNLQEKLKTLDPKTEYQMDDDGNAVEVVGNPDYTSVQTAIDQLQTKQGDLTKRFDNLSVMEGYGRELVGPGGHGGGGDSAGGTVITTGSGSAGGGQTGGGQTGGGGIVCPIPGH